MIYYRVANENDTDLVLELLKKIDGSFPIPLSTKTDLVSLSKKFIDVGGVCLAMDDDEAVGMVGFYANDSINKAAYISVVGVVSSHQRRGIAREMVARTLRLCSDNGMRTCTLYTHKTNIGAIYMYTKMGFVAHEDVQRPNDIKFVIEI